MTPLRASWIVPPCALALRTPHGLPRTTTSSEQRSTPLASRHASGSSIVVPCKLGVETSNARLGAGADPPRYASTRTVQCHDSTHSRLLEHAPPPVSRRRLVHGPRTQGRLAPAPGGWTIAIVWPSAPVSTRTPERTRYRTRPSAAQIEPLTTTISTITSTFT